MQPIHSSKTLDDFTHKRNAGEDDNRCRHQRGRDARADAEQERVREARARAFDGGRATCQHVSQ